MNYDNDACHLIARFGEDSPVTAFKLTRYQPGDAFDITFYGKALRYDNPRMRAVIGFGVQPRSTERQAIVGDLNGKLPLIILNSLRLDGAEPTRDDPNQPEVGPDMEREVTGIDLKVRGKWYWLDTGPLDAPMAAMRTCLSDLVGHWGYDPAVQASLIRRPEPVGSAGTWLRSADYPDNALHKGHNGVVQFRLDIDETGSVVGCNILHRTSPDEFADITCRNLAKRAKFTPALDAKGNPVRSYYVNKVLWQIPG